MSSDPIIRLDGLNKSFPIYEKPMHRLYQMLSPQAHKQRWFRQFQALKNISLTIRKGETLGVVGRNGSGKSTLLQVICGTLTPSSGEVRVDGRIAALLELGSGFNPEFTGRENVFLYGTVLGLTRQQVQERFDDIAAFADIGEFIDQPVKNYSSGMYVRLAFAVAINVTPDILVVDEALSVGDEAFQRKCFARINRIRDDGATVLFVSHSAGIVTQLCDRAVLLDRGELLLDGSPKFVVSRYHKMLYAPPGRIDAIRDEIRNDRDDGGVPTAKPVLSMSSVNQDDERLVASATALPSPCATGLSQGWFDEGLVPQSTVRYDKRGATISMPCVETPDGRRVNVLRAGDDYVYVYRVSFQENAVGVRFGMLIKTLTGVELGGAASSLPQDSLPLVEAGQTIEVRFRFRCLLDGGTYFCNAGVLAHIAEEETYIDRLIDAAMFRVMPQPERLATGVIDFCVSSEVAVASGSEARA
ncbi:ABC transporter ATP-binding protein [Rhodanobacter sp. DHG33]|uniref:ABC transporter ATP-binding protein n=1 Tax=Rhodanobacter sp. DHG33 TaxID=2775921 RepID=UPI0017868D41|nr:ABC transporter ATP-binding protein [Rhodanobacter sp. DHG33]MBD8897665.1 ABC transporter ATP-binding protein [Rhodanobacter sp. DHG33]